MRPGKPFWKNALWIVIITILTLIAVTGWVFHQQVNQIDRQLENIRNHESQ